LIFFRLKTHRKDRSMTVESLPERSLFGVLLRSPMASLHKLAKVLGVGVGAYKVFVIRSVARVIYVELRSPA